MIIAIIETGHFQYALTQYEIFSDCEIHIITTETMKSDMIEYSPEAAQFNFHIIQKIANDELQIMKIIESFHIELLLISPVFDSYSALRRIVQNLSCKKVITIHNINTWFNGRFWSPNSLQDKLNMTSIIKNCDYIAVEDFIFNHLKNTNHKLFKKHKFLYIPFTIFNPYMKKKYVKKESKLKIVLTGAIDGDRRKYEDLLEVIHSFKEREEEINFSFAGRAKGEYGSKVQNKLRGIKKSYPKLVSFFENDSTVDMFRFEMETSDIVLSTSTEKFKGMGTTEFIGETKPTGAIYEMVTYSLPGLLPEHLYIPQNLKGSVFNYKSSTELIVLIEKLLSRNELLNEWKDAAKKNSLNYTAERIRIGLPF